MHRLLGKGGFGEVHEVEMLVPRGLEVYWDEKGNLSFDEDGYVALQRSDDSTTQKSRPHGGGDTDGPSPSEAAPQAEASLSSMSMTPSENMWFSLVRREQVVGGGGGPSGGGLGLSSEELSSEDDCRFVQRSGVFFAMKLQSARNEKQLDSLVKEVENMRLLSGEAGIVQLKDHAIDRKSLHLIILMELGACDLHEFLKQDQYCLDVQSIARVWSILVHRIETLHKFDVIHRDIKPQNFILVPTDGYRGAGILARTSTPRKDFVFRLVQCDEEGPRKQRGDVELVLKHPTTNKEEVVPLSIKLTDFGIARSLDADAAHLSLPGPNGTVVFMAPEAVRQTVSRSRKVSKRVDIWALGVVLYQMLHAGKTPFGDYLVSGGPPEALLAVASETVNREAMNFDASNIWRAERARLLLDSSETHPDSSQNLPTMTAEMVRQLVASWVGAEFLVRVCKRCLVFDVNDRIDGKDLRVWVDEAIESGWGLRNSNVLQSELLQAAFNIDANGRMQTVDIEIARIGERVGASVFPAATSSAGAGPSRTNRREFIGSSSAISNSSDELPMNCTDFVDLEAPRNDHKGEDTDRSISESGACSSLERPRRGFVWILVWILVCIVGVAVGSGFTAMWLSRKNGGDAAGGGSVAVGPKSPGVVGVGDENFAQLPPKSPGVVGVGFGSNGTEPEVVPSTTGIIPSAKAPVFPSSSSSSSPSPPRPASHPEPRFEPPSHSAVRNVGPPAPFSKPSVTAREEGQEEKFASLKKFVLGVPKRAALVLLSKELQDPDPDLVFTDPVAQAISARDLKLVPTLKRLRADKDVVLAAVATDGMALQYASEELRADDEVVAAAVGMEYGPSGVGDVRVRNPLPLEYAFPRVGDDVVGLTSEGAQQLGSSAPAKPLSLSVSDVEARLEKLLRSN